MKSGAKGRSIREKIARDETNCLTAPRSRKGWMSPCVARPDIMETTSASAPSVASMRVAAREAITARTTSSRPSTTRAPVAMMDR